MRDMIDWERLREVLKALRRRWKVFAGLLLVYMVLFTEVNLNPDVETYMTPVVSDEEAIAASEKGNWEPAIRFTAQRAAKGEVEAQALLADFYDRGMPPLHVDHCRAFDWYVKAGQNGDLRSQDKVAEMLITGLGGYLAPIHTYFWAKHALEEGYEPAESTITKYLDRKLSRLSESERAELDQALSDWDPTQTRPEKRIMMPVVPILSLLLAQFIPIRDCDDPTVLQHLLQLVRYL